MFPAIPQHDGCASSTDVLHHKQEDSSSQCPLGQGEENGFCCNDGNVKKPLGAQDGGASPHAEVPGFRDKRTHRRVLVPVPVLALLLALAVAVAVLSAGCGPSLGASLAVLEREWEMEFLSHLKGNVDSWLGLRRQGERLEWVDGSSFNHTSPVGSLGHRETVLRWGALGGPPHPDPLTKVLLQMPQTQLKAAAGIGDEPILDGG
ncbi:uncharacterized protein FYN12_014625 [Phoenicopterus ruber ruber]